MCGFTGLVMTVVAAEDNTVVTVSVCLSADVILSEK